ncbi:MAG: 30S ribosomal protein S15 [Flavobacteriales bacterium Tduv]
MYLTEEKKKEIFSKYGKSEADTGSHKGQVAVFTFRINHLTKHLKFHKKDFNTERSLIKMVAKRAKLLKYVKKGDLNAYKEVIQELGIRK